ncbi:MAG: glycosyltransferase family A protein [archaeon]
MSIVIATTTLYTNEDIIRIELAKQTIRQATEKYPTIVIDGGSPDEFLREIERYGAIVQQEEETGIGNSRRQAIKLAHNLGTQIIAWTEPEKVDYIKNISKTAQPLLYESDIVIPRRKSLESYPVFQQLTEEIGNEVWEKLTNIDLDMWFGPRIWKRELTDYFLDYDGNSWDSIFIPVMNAIIDKKYVSSVTIDYTHPNKQREIEEYNPKFYIKRAEQLKSLTDILKEHWNKKKKK